MTPERWRQIDEIFQTALELDPGERVTFLDSSCAGDEKLRSEIESLISSDAQGLSLIEDPAFEVAAGLVAAEGFELKTGQRLGNYEILGSLGVGGMGEVYLAEDAILGRKIALKLLPADFTKSEERLRRFRQEARAASALNHPNILTIHEINQVEGRYYIATEFVDGETLRQLLKPSRLSLTDAVEIATQVASALAAAHQAGIVHRDIKPENIMLRRDGYVKILDFGLAKLTEQQSTPAEGVHTENKADTTPGLVMGTVKYMSPEQARGLEVDVRSDIFSFGVVLYEMIAGRGPFEGETNSDVIAALLKEEPAPLRNHAPNTPDELQLLVSRALRKKKEDRYQTISQLLTDLKGLKEHLEPEPKLRLSPQGSHLVKISEPRETQTRANRVAASTVSGINKIVSRVIQQRAALTVTLVAFLIVMVGLIFGFYKFSRPKKNTVPFQNMKLTRLTASGKASMPVISPDGRYVFYGREDGKQVSLWLKEIGSPNETQIVSPGDTEFGGASFSPDGRYIYYSTAQVPRSIRLDFTIHKVPVSGESPVKLLMNVASGVRVSPDGKQLVYFRHDLSRSETAMMIANADGTNERTVLTRQLPDQIALSTIPSWSPNGRSLAAVDIRSGEGLRFIEIDTVSGREKVISSRKWNRVGGVVWLPDLTGLIVAAGEEQSRNQIWHLSYPTGEATRVTNDIADYNNISISSDGKFLITEQSENQSKIWTVPVDAKNHFLVDPTIARQISTNRFDGRQGLAVCPDGRIVYTSEETGNLEIWIMDADGENRKQLTHHPRVDNRPAVSPDGRYIVFQSLGHDDWFQIWRMDIDGGTLKQLTTGQNDRTSPSFSPDGQWVVYNAWESKQPTIWKLPIEGGEPTQITTAQSHTPVFSPDGKQIAYGYFAEKSQPKVAVIPSEGGEPIATFDLPRGYLTLRWTPDGKGLSCLIAFRRGVGNIWVQPIEGGPLKQLTHFTTDGLWYNSWSLDGNQLAFARGIQTKDVILLNDLE